MSISEVEIYNPYDKDLVGRRNIGFGVSKIFARPLGVSLTSVLENNKNINFNIHIFFEELAESDIYKLKKTASKYKQVIFFHYVKNTKKLFGKVKWDNKIWQATYYRLVAVSAMPKFIDRLLWLDSDICCNGSLEELFTINMEGYPIGAVIHGNQKSLVPDSIARLKLKSGKYFNAGIILFNLKEWNKRDLSMKTFKMINEPQKEWKLYDQDMFNCMIDGDFLELDYIYNFQRLGGTLKYKKIPDCLKIFHYVGPEKPWYKYKSEYQDEWLKYSNISFWNDVELLVPEMKKENASYFRYMARSELKSFNVLKSVEYYYQYLRLKLI